MLANLTPTGRSMLLNGGASGLINAAGGAVRVALFLGGVEVSGNGYSRQSASSAGLAISDPEGAGASLAPTVFTASGASITYDQIRLFARNNTTELGRTPPLGTQTITVGRPRQIGLQLRMGEPKDNCYDASVYSQLATMTGPRATIVRDGTAVIPILNSSGVPVQLAQYVKYTKYRGIVDFDWECWAAPSVEAGTVQIASGVVTGAGTNFPNYGAGALFYYNGIIYPVASWQSATQVTLQNTGLSAPAGSAYKLARWDHREIDPKFAVPGEMERAHDEYAHAFSLVRDAAISNGCGIGMYSFLVPLNARNNDIRFDATYPQWQADVATCINYTTSSGFRLLDLVIETGGLVFLPSYVPAAFIATEGLQEGYILRTQRIVQTCLQLGIPCAPLFSTFTIEGYGQWVATGSGQKVPEAMLRRLIETTHALQPGRFAFWSSFSSQFGFGLASDIPMLESITGSLVY